MANKGRSAGTDYAGNQRDHNAANKKSYKSKTGMSERQYKEEQNFLNAVASNGRNKTGNENNNGRGLPNRQNHPASKDARKRAGIK